MNELALKYGCNPNQKPSRIYMEDGSDLPVTVLNGKPGYINFLDALNSIQLVKELKAACGLPAAASFKHVSPAGAALGLPLTDVERKMYHIAPDMELSPLACAYARARGADRMSSFGDWIALSDICDVPTAKLIQHEVSDGIIAPGYEPEALAILSGKKKGNYNVVAIDPAYKPNPVEHKQVYGITFEQGRNELAINADTMLTNWVTENKDVTEEQKRDLLFAWYVNLSVRSNGVVIVKDGQTLSVGTGEQDRVGAIEQAIAKFRQKYTGEGTLQNSVMSSDGFFPFEDGVETAAAAGVTAIIAPSGSLRDADVIKRANELGVALYHAPERIFSHH